jgi:ubiquinone/menaquinone biosynthesis C-methylase UbiE
MISKNIDKLVVKGFGDEWERFDQSALGSQERQEIFDSYFSIFPWQALPHEAVGFDLGCGSGRWAKLVAPLVGRLHCIDPSVALDVAKRNLAGISNCEFHGANVDTMPFADGSMDFGYSLGVLHHIPDTKAAMAKCVKKLKPGAPFLVYLYYDFENRPYWFQLVWRISNLIRIVVSHLPFEIRYIVTQFIALFIYFPIAKISHLTEKLGLKTSSLPLYYYRHKSFYTMRTDALDRFGTRLEQRFSKNKINEMMLKSGLKNIVFSDNEPFWCAVGYRK